MPAHTPAHHKNQRPIYPSRDSSRKRPPRYMQDSARNPRAAIPPKLRAPPSTLPVVVYIGYPGSKVEHAAANLVTSRAEIFSSGFSPSFRAGVRGQVLPGCLRKIPGEADFARRGTSRISRNNKDRRAHRTIFESFEFSRFVSRVLFRLSRARFFCAR